jgi:hypothetical protein
MTKLQNRVLKVTRKKNVLLATGQFDTNFGLVEWQTRSKMQPRLCWEFLVERCSLISAELEQQAVNLVKF